MCVLHRRQGHYSGDRPAQRPGSRPAEAHADLVLGGAAVPAGARVPAMSVRGRARAHGARQAAQSVGNSGNAFIFLHVIIASFAFE